MEATAVSSDWFGFVVRLKKWVYGILFITVAGLVVLIYCLGAEWNNAWNQKVEVPTLSGVIE